MVLRGDRAEDDTWRWKRLETGTTSHLRSLAVGGGVLWAVGSEGTVIASFTDGESWLRWPPILDSKGNKVELSRIRDTGSDDGIWILGDDIVLRGKRP